MATVLEVYTTKEQRSAVSFSCGQKDSMHRMFIKKYFLFTAGSICRVKRFTTGWQTFRWWRRGWNGGVEVAETTFKGLLCCGFRRIDKAMGQVYQCWWRIYREINVFPGSNIVCFTFYIHLWPIYWLSLVPYKLETLASRAKCLMDFRGQLSGLNSVPRLNSLLTATANSFPISFCRLRDFCLWRIRQWACWFQ
jgi:hypothetical protein